jgi:4-hydroxybenzoate polyprenyltransferase/phosphoserine phosphatase
MSEQPTTAPRPLCVDLDGTLVKTDTFAQALLQLIRIRPAALFSIPGWAKHGLAAFKKQVAREIQLDPAALPYQPELLRYLKNEQQKGRNLILATASDQSVARRVAEHLGIFSDIIASDGTVNLKADRKRKALVEKFGEGGFDYAGNAADDLEVWASAAKTIAVNPSSSVRRALSGQRIQTFDDRPPKWQAWLKALRVQQWMKNVLIFLPMLLAQELTTPVLYVQAVIAFFAFSFLASSIYVVNDLMDLHADQHHPRKNRRPFAAGNLSLLSATVAVPLLVVMALILAQFLTFSFCGILLFYLLLTTLYSWRIKQLFLLDVLTLAGFYTIRILAGTAAYGVATSGWLIAFSISIFFSLALVKRYAELREALEAHPEKIGARGRGYHARHLPWLSRLGLLAGIFSAIVLGLYITSEKVVVFYNTPAALWGLCPLVLYWIARIWKLAIRGELSDDPLEFAATDRQTWIIGALGIVLLIAGAL